MYTKNMNRYLDPRISCEYDKSEIRVEEETKKKAVAILCGKIWASMCEKDSFLLYFLDSSRQGKQVSKA